MRNARIMGNYIQHLADENGISEKNLAEILECSERNVLELFKGFVYPSFAQVTKLADLFNVSAEDILLGNSTEYNKTVVHCMNDFDFIENREFILDLIENYVDIKNAVGSLN